MTPTLERITAAIGQIDPELRPASDGFSEAAILLASMMMAADEVQIAAELEYDPEFVSIVGSRLRASGIWRRRKLAKSHSDAWSRDSGGIAFGLDCNVARGDMIVVERRGGEPNYRLTAQAETRVRRMIAGAKP